MIAIAESFEERKPIPWRVLLISAVLLCASLAWPPLHQRYERDMARIHSMDSAYGKVHRALRWIAPAAAILGAQDVLGVVIRAIPTAVSPVITANQSTGVAPFGIVFSTENTTVSGALNAFRDLRYTWAYGDSASVGSAVWENGALSVTGESGQSKNVDYGPVGAHVFEAGCPANTCSVTLVVCRICTGADNVSATPVSITVYANSDATNGYGGARTTCVGSGSTPTAGMGFCPAGAAVADQSNYVTAVSTYLASANKQLLFDPAGTFTATTSATLTGAGPRSIGAGGAGNWATLINTTTTGSNNQPFQFGATTGQWSISDIEFGPLSDGHDDIRAAGSGTGNTGAQNILLLRPYVHDIGAGFEVDCNTTATTVNSGIMLVSATVQHIISSSLSAQHKHGFLACAQYMANIGNLMDDGQDASYATEHMFRIQYWKWYLNAHNTISKIPTTKDSLAMRGLRDGFYPSMFPSGCPSQASQYGLVADNYFKMGNVAGINIAPSNDSQTTCIQDAIIERNYFIGDSSPYTGTIITITLQATQQTVRNNIFNVTIPAAQTYAFGKVISVVGPTASPGANNTLITNNSYFSSTAATFTGVLIDATSTNTTAQNNLAYVMSATGTPRTVNDLSGLATTCASCNSSTNQIKTVLPFAVNPPTKPTDYATISSYARTDGVSPSPSNAAAGGGDFFIAAPQSPYRIGAVN